MHEKRRREPPGSDPAAVHRCPDGGCGCVAPLTPPADRLAALQATLDGETAPVVAITHLLRLCRDDHSTLWEHQGDPACRARVKSIVEHVAGGLPGPGAASTIPSHARKALASALTAEPAVPPAVIAHALADLLDDRYGHAFPAWFRDRSPYQPAVGDPIPLDSPDLRQVTELPPTAPPWRLANRLDETRRVRLAGGWATQFRVVFDYRAYDALAGIITPDTVVATVHPNRALAELGLPAGDRPRFPVAPIDPERQLEIIDQLIAAAADAGAGIIVVPELAVTAPLAERLEMWVREPGPIRLLVAGSFHHRDGSRRANRAVAWARDLEHGLTHDKHSPADRPVLEDITPSGLPELRVHVTADGWHLVIAICRDLLNPHAVHALTEAGANLILAPSMSETLVPFGGPVAQLVGSTQAFVAVANNPADWSLPGDAGATRPARALFGHPGFAHQTRHVHAPDAGTGIALLRVRAGQVSWRAEKAAAASWTPTEEPDDDPPPWTSAVARRTTSNRFGGAGAVTLRPAAVLAVLVDRPEGPEVLLTGRSLDLTNYPGQLVLPGGAVDPDDRDVVDAALREAREEIGLDPDSVNVLGTLPALALADSGFLVTPVVAWTRAPRFTHPANPAEVTVVVSTPLRDVGASHDGPAIAVDAAGEPIPLGTMTAAVLDLLAAAYVVAYPESGPSTRLSAT